METRKQIAETLAKNAARKYLAEIRLERLAAELTATDQQHEAEHWLALHSA